MCALYVGDATGFGDQKILHINSPSAQRCGNGDDIVNNGEPICFDDIHIAAIFGYTILCINGPVGQQGGKCWG